MNGKTCQLCGRPLGKAKAGSGGDFCSREHRNQYRLRRSMDCLTEANKVATLARRRENPKPLFGAAIAGGSAAEPRGFLQAPNISGSPQPKPLEIPPTNAALKADLPRGGIRLLRVRGGGAAPAHAREFGIMLAPGNGPGRLALKRPPGAPGGSNLGGSRAPRVGELSPAPSAGKALRVSVSVRFSPVAPERRYSAPRGPVLESRPAPRPLTLPPHAAAGGANTRMGFGVMPFSGAPDLPAATEWIDMAGYGASGREHRI